MITDTGGIGRSPASEVWEGMKAAAEQAHSRATFLPVPEAKLAETMSNSLIAQRCTVIVGIGEAEASAVEHLAASGKHPKVHFAVVGSPSHAGVTGFAATQAATKEQVATLLGNGSAS